MWSYAPTSSVSQACPSGISCNIARKEPSWKAKQDLSTALYQNALALPCAQKAACREKRNVGLIGQFLIPNVKLDASWNLLADSAWPN